jgi:hypothetical protein
VQKYKAIQFLCVLRGLDVVIDAGLQNSQKFYFSKDLEKIAILQAVYLIGVV